MAITGASSGIGAALAEAFGAEKCRVAVSARRRPKLEEVADRARDAGAQRVRVAEVDVTDPADLAAWADDLGAAWDGLDVAVANAGVGQYGHVLDLDPGDVTRVVDTDLLGVWRTVRAVGDLLQAAEGQAIVVGSMISYVPTPYMSLYGSIKAGLRAWTQAARPELARRGIDLTLVQPGATRTEFPENALKEPGISYEDLKEAIGRGWPAAKVARRCVKAARRRPKEVDMTLLGRAGRVLGAVAPNLLARLLEPAMRPGRRDRGSR